MAGRVRGQGPDGRGRAQAASARQEGRALIVAVTSAPSPELLAAAADAYLDVFSEPPYGETEADREAFVERVRRYAERDGFRLVLSTEDDKRVHDAALADCPAPVAILTVYRAGGSFSANASPIGASGDAILMARRLG